MVTLKTQQNLGKSSFNSELITYCNKITFADKISFVAKKKYFYTKEKDGKSGYWHNGKKL